jgi:hypothetical protein
VLVLGLLAACASSRESKNITPAFAEHTPRSIRVFPVSNRTAHEDASGVVERLLTDELEDRGYEVVKDADARLHVVIEQWSSTVEPWRGRSKREVTLEARLYDEDTETMLWSDRRSASDEEDDDEDEGGWLDGLIDYVFDATTEVAFDGWGSVGDEAVVELLESLPRAPR